MLRHSGEWDNWGTGGMAKSTHQKLNLLYLAKITQEEINGT